MTPEQFVAKWRGATLKERSAAQEHFIDLCRLLDEPTPAEADPSGVWYCFEKGAKKAGGGDGWADVWKRGCFGWEYKGRGKDLQAAFRQLQLYTPALEYPPLLIVCDLERIVIHTAFTGTVPEIRQINLEDLHDAAQRRQLKWVFTEPERLRPGVTTQQITEQAAGKLGELAVTLRARGHDPQAVAHFLNRILFCLFAEDTDLLPQELVTKLLKTGQKHPARLPAMLADLFGAMAAGGPFGVELIDWFNGGLFDSQDVLPLEPSEIQTLLELAYLDWSAVEPAIFGTLFERGLDPDKRAQLGAHYTDPGSIMRLVKPVVVEPLQDEWRALKAKIAEQMDKAARAKDKSATTKAINAANTLYQGFMVRLADFRVLDPACGSGNFLYLALGALKDLEHQVMLEAEALGLLRGFPLVGPNAVKGIEINPYAAELARVTVWIGEIQWMLKHGFNVSRNPILRPLDNIEQRDAILNADGTEPEWPGADVIIGNPPFLGGSKKRGALGDYYFEALERLYAGRVPAGADLVTYWFEKARAQIEKGKVRAAGLVATNSIRQPTSRPVLDAVTESTRIFEAWSDEPWINEGAAVRVSLVGFGDIARSSPPHLNGKPVLSISSDLTGNGISGTEAALIFTKAARLGENKVAFQGTKKYGDFNISGSLARSWLQAPNPNGRPNSDVVKPWLNGKSVTSRSADTWIIDYGVTMPEADAALYELPFQHVLTHVKPYRETVRREKTRRRWWIHEEPRPGLRRGIQGRPRVVATPMTAKHRMFFWLDTRILPDQQLIVIARADDTTFGILHSRFHECWSLRMCTWLGKGNDPRYTPTTTFETFPFPEGLTPADTAGPTETLDSAVILPSVAPEHRAAALAIAEAAHRLNALRESWLNPPEWVERVPEVVPGYPDRIIPRPGHEAELKKRTLTNLYNQRPTWLDNSHQALDAAVAVAYGWEDYTSEMPEEEILRRLLALNLERS